MANSSLPLPLPAQSLTYKSVDALAAGVEHIHRIDTYFALTRKYLIRQGVPQARIGAVYVHRDGVRIGTYHPLYVVLLKCLRKVGYREGAVLQLRTVRWLVRWRYTDPTNPPVVSKNRCR